ncbi:MAG: acyltransferase family protein [Actinomycetota bacterium]
MSSDTTRRLDIEGMRAIAIGAVLLYHAGIPGFAGGYVGVDVFFVISGFLITGAMTREIESTGSLSLGQFWARRAKRLLPAALLALAGSAVIAWTWMPVTQRETFGGDIIAAATYVVNWRFGARSVDYLAEDVGASPVQHFWSLAVEEQFYIVWPILVVLALALATKLNRSRTGSLLVVILSVCAASLWWSIVSTADDPSVAFFSTFTRLWELGIGAALAVAAPHLTRLPSRVYALSGWVGLAAIAYATLVFSETTAWPSARAGVPAVGAALVLICGLAPSTGSPVGLLSVRPAVWIGGLSYSLYLWHWPLLVGWEARAGEPLGAVEASIVVLVSFVPAIAAHRFVENPVRFAAGMRRTGTALGVGAACMVASILVGVALIWTVPAVQAVDDDLALGAQALAPAPTTDDVAAVDDAETDASGQGDGTGESGSTDASVVEEPPAEVIIIPDPLDAATDFPDAYEGRCQVGRTTVSPRSCNYGSDDAEQRIALIGDSKAVQWESALQTLAEESGWRLTTMAKSGCAFSTAAQPIGDGLYDSCLGWNDAVMEVLAAAPPDIVVVSNGVRAGFPVDGTDGEPTITAMAEGYAERWDQLAALGSTVVVILDNPGPGRDMPECVANNRTTLDECSFTVRDDTSAAFTQREALTLSPETSVIDLTPLICPDICPPVIGNVMLYRQGSHLTRTYVDTLAPFIGIELGRITDGTFS